MSLNKLAEILIDFRRRISPRTSYESSTELVVVSNKESITQSIDTLQLTKVLIDSKEFSHVKTTQFSNQTMEGISMNNQVIVSFFPDLGIMQYFANLIVSRKTILTHCLFSTSLINQIRTLSTQLESNSSVSFVRVLIQSLDDSLILVTLHRSSGSTPASSSSASSLLSTAASDALRVGNWGHPSVYSRRQFHYLWIDASAIEGRRRVLQRLIGYSVNRAGKSYKLKGEYFDQLINDIVRQAGSDDYTVYSTLRKVFKEETLDANTHVEYPLPLAMLQSVQDYNTNGGDEGDGRANFMASRTFECIPKDRVGKIRSYLDYGCAEGSITDHVRKLVGVDVASAFGADVRSLDPTGFTFILLPKEDENPTSVGTILPSLKSSSIDFITSAMVFHHVRHVEAALLELRRVVSKDGVLVLREHDCQSASEAVFLDITHGLYSLVLSDPVEWPSFLDEYRAWYRSRDQWNDILRRCGFSRLENQPDNYLAKKHYEGSRGPVPPITGSLCNSLNLRNLIKAYYAVYVPCAPDPALLAAHTAPPVSRPDTRVALTSQPTENEQAVKRQKPSIDTVPCISVGNDRNVPETAVALFESSKYPGRYYITDMQGKTHWLPTQSVVFEPTGQHTDSSLNGSDMGSFVHPITKLVTRFHSIKKA